VEHSKKAVHVHIHTFACKYIIIHKCVNVYIHIRIYMYILESKKESEEVAECFKKGIYMYILT